MGFSRTPKFQPSLLDGGRGMFAVNALSRRLCKSAAVGISHRTLADFRVAGSELVQNWDPQA